MTTADRIYELINTLPPDQANEVLDFAEFLQQKAAGRSPSPVTEKTYDITKTKTFPEDESKFDTTTYEPIAFSLRQSR